jgi:ribosome-associated toxin RatA of RatAB toxin-antitoxin module
LLENVYKIIPNSWMGAALALGLAVSGAGLGCASTTPTSGWAENNRPGKGIVPDTVPDPDVPQDGTAGVLNREPTRESIPIAGSELVRGRSAVIVEAPLDVVRKTVLDYGSYTEFMPHYAGSRMLGRTPNGGHQVYMKWVALHGAMTMWARFDMSPAQKKGKQETYRSKLIKGNVKAAVAIWRMSPISEKRTKLSLEVFLQPRVPVPDALLNDENVSGAMKGVKAMRKQCESLATAK